MKTLMVKELVKPVLRPGEQHNQLLRLLNAIFLME
jgi:hypothetical protein